MRELDPGTTSGGVHICRFDGAYKCPLAILYSTSSMRFVLLPCAESTVWNRLVTSPFLGTASYASFLANQCTAFGAHSGGWLESNPYHGIILCFVCWRMECARTGGIIKGQMLCKSGWAPPGLGCRCGICGIVTLWGYLCGLQSSGLVHSNTYYLARKRE